MEELWRNKKIGSKVGNSPSSLDGTNLDLKAKKFETRFPCPLKWIWTTKE
jgi:hypothetical protein